MSVFNVFRRDIPAFRYTASTISASGDTIDGAESSFTIKASCQNTRPEDVEYLPENRRNDGATYRIYTDDVVNTIENNSNPDQVELFGQRFELSQSEKWLNFTGGNSVVNHNKYLTVRVVNK